MGGLEATAAIRERERLSGTHIRIVAMTAHAMTGDRERCLAAGMDGYLSKPINPRLLFATLEHEAGQPAPIASADRAQPISSPPTTGIDREGLMARLGHDEALLSEVIRLFLEDCPERLIAIKAAVDARDAVQIRATAHCLKGTAGNISAAALYDAARALERMGDEERLEGADAAWRRLSTEATIVMHTLRGFEASAAAEKLLCAR